MATIEEDVKTMLYYICLTITFITLNVVFNSIPSPLKLCAIYNDVSQCNRTDVCPPTEFANESKEWTPCGHLMFALEFIKHFDRIQRRHDQQNLMAFKYECDPLLGAFDAPRSAELLTFESTSSNWDFDGCCSTCKAHDRCTHFTYARIEPHDHDMLDEMEVYVHHKCHLYGGAPNGLRHAEGHRSGIKDGTGRSVVTSLLFFRAQMYSQVLASFTAIGWIVLLAVTPTLRAIRYRKTMVLMEILALIVGVVATLLTTVGMIGSYGIYSYSRIMSIPALLFSSLGVLAHLYFAWITNHTRTSAKDEAKRQAALSNTMKPFKMAGYTHSG